MTWMGELWEAGLLGGEIWITLASDAEIVREGLMWKSLGHRVPKLWDGRS